MKSKMCVRVVVLAAIFAWPAVETYRTWQAHQQLAAAAKVEQKVSLRLADAKTKATTQVAHTEAR